MINQTYIDDKKVKNILTYIAGMRHAEQIRIMFLCSLNGMRSINFCYLQVKDVYNDDLSVKDVICLDENKNKGKFGANYYLNSQMKKEFREYLKFLKSKEDELNPDDYLFKSQKFQLVGYSLTFIRSSTFMGQVIWVGICSYLNL